MAQKKRILVSPLNWGLGHASRSAQLITELERQGHELILASNGQALSFLQKEFPNNKTIEIPGIDITYGKGRSFFVVLIGQLPTFLAAIKKEHEAVQKIVAAEKIDVVISDNRYGVYHKDIPSVLITHQVNPIAKGLASLFVNRARKYILKQIEKFTECWIPDTSNGRLSGQLSEFQERPKNVRYIGPLSRFKRIEGLQKEVDVCVILSGPEPQRSIFDELVMKELSTAQKANIQVVRGLPHAPELKISGNINVRNHLNRNDLQELILKSRLVISRPGYSSIMDYSALGAKAAFVPTPGQTEQIYLANKFQENDISPFQTQKEFNLNGFLKVSKYFKGFEPQQDDSLLKKAVEEFFNSI